MKYNFTEKREVTLKHQGMKNGSWTVVLLERGIQKYVFNRATKSKNSILTLLKRISDTNHIDTKYWTKFN
ncbi:MAG: hypothetical protein DRQ35_05325 [Gammaproteobacteria bacterium]|nr:MAG: hypothetical protein DRQ35_05325 [Gammaproteobacteria bacterium]